MMKAITQTIILLLFVSSGYSQVIWQNPLPQGDHAWKGGSYP